MPILCQQEPPIWGVVQKETIQNSSIATQHGCFKTAGQLAALASGPSLARQLCSAWPCPTPLLSSVLCSALLHAGWLCTVLGCSAALQQDTSIVPAQPGKQSSIIGGKGKWTQRQRTAGLYGQTTHAPGPRVVCPHSMRTPNSHNLIGPKDTFLIAQNGAA